MTKNIVIGVLVATTLLFGGLFFSGGHMLGSTGPGSSVYQPWHFLQGFAAGGRDQFAVDNAGKATFSSTGTAITRVNTGNCFIKAYATTIAASTTALVDCQATAAVSPLGVNAIAALTGVTSGDFVQVTLSTTTSSSVGMGLVLQGATASNTPGYIQLQIANQTGTTYTWPTTGTASGTAAYLVTK